MYLWRAVDDEGQVLDMLVHPRRDSRSALRLMRQLLKKQGFVPKIVVTDNLRWCCQVNSSRSETPESGMGDHIAATAFRHSLAASARKIRSVDRETRWR
jgi:transposase-like protein